MKCNCNQEVKTGQTSVMCCNICGLPDEDFWQPPLSSIRSEQEIRDSLAEMERMAKAAEDILNSGKVKDIPVLLKNFELWKERSKARANILKWALGLPYLEELPPLMKV